MPKRRRRLGQDRVGRPRRGRRGCLLWIVALILMLIVLSILFGGFQRGTKVGEGSRHESVAGLLDAVAAGRLPAPDGGFSLLPQPSARDAGVLAFTAHAVIFTDADPGWVAAQLPPGALAVPLSPAFLQALAERTGRQAHSIDMLCVAAALPGPPPIELMPEPTADHPRIARALRYRDDIRAWRARGGVVLLGRGVAGRWEAAIEVDPAYRDRGLGRRLATAARHLVPGAPLWAQIAPGNAASVRAFLAAGFAPVGAEALLTPRLPE